MAMRVGILGYGEIGKGIADCIANSDSVDSYIVKISDPELGFVADLSDCDVIHACVPNGALLRAMGELRGGNKTKDQIFIVHTTTEVGNCQIARDTFAFSFKALFHAPVRGKHPELCKSLQVFEMMVTGPQEHSAELEVYLKSIGIQQYYVGEDYKTTEVAKLMSTLRLAWEVMWRKHMESVCKQFGVDPEIVHDEWTETYNDGYLLMDCPHFVRSNLDFVPGPIGGHCVISNAKLLEEYSEVARWILSLNRKLESDAPTAIAPTQISVE